MHRLAAGIRINLVPRVRHLPWGRPTGIVLKFPMDWRYTPPPSPVGGPSNLTPEALGKLRAMVLQVAAMCDERWTALERFKDNFAKALGEPYNGSSDEGWAQTDLMRLIGAAAANPVTFVEALVGGMADVADLCENNVPSEATINSVLAESGLGFLVKGDKMVLTTQVSPKAAEPMKPVYSKPVTVLISSPGDLREERIALVEVCKAVATKLGIVVRPILWEGGGQHHPDVPPFAPVIKDASAQEIIDAQVFGSDGGLDVYVGMIWSRMGTPTGKYRSGTEAELEASMESMKNAGRPEVLFYQKKGHLPDDVDPEQLKLVRQFAKELEGRGLRGEFRSTDELRRIFAQHLEERLIAAAARLAANDPGHLKCPQCGGTQLELTEEKVPEFDVDEDGHGYVDGYSVIPGVQCTSCGWQLDR